MSKIINFECKNFLILFFIIICTFVWNWILYELKPNLINFESRDILMLSLSIIWTCVWTFVWTWILYLLRPNLLIESVQEKDDKLKINIINSGRSNAVNLKIEACVIKNGFTYHLKLDVNDFIILPPKKKTESDAHYRIFKIDDISDSATEYTNFTEIMQKLTEEGSDYILRVRLHANHEYSGFGKAFESKFKWENKFIKIL